MSLPTTVFPTQIDGNTTLYNVKDNATIKLSQNFDYNGGDRTIYVEADTNKISLFPANGIITLTEQCSEPEFRAVSFYYETIDYTNFSFTNLTPLPETKISSKQALNTTVSLNVTAQHHNNIKDAVIATETYIGKKTDKAFVPFFGNLAQRLYFLATIIFKPRAWFTVSSIKTIGLAPFTVKFKNYSFLLGEKILNNNIVSEWDFGDGNKKTILNDLNTDVEHTYLKPGIYDVTLTVTNMFGVDSVTFKNLINAKYEAPIPAVIEQNLATGQKIFDETTKLECGQTTSTAITSFLKTTVNIPVYLEVPAGIRPDNKYTFSGERVGPDDKPIDKILEYTWLLGDNLSHGNSLTTTALYSIGGFYNLVLRCDTESLAYRITIDENKVNVTEITNAWLINKCKSTNSLDVYEMGFLSEIFKTVQRTTATIATNDTFLDSYPNVTTQGAKLEFSRNNYISGFDSKTSGFQGSSAIIPYASGRNATDAPTLEAIKAIQFYGFDEVITAYNEYIGRAWNWIAFGTLEKTRFLFGNALSQPANTNNTNLDVLVLDHKSGVYKTEYTYSPGDFLSASSYLQYNIVAYNTSSGLPLGGNYSMYRTSFRNDKGYVLKNITTGSNFQLKGFYVSEPTASLLFSKWDKLPDLAGPKKAQAQLVNLSSGLFLFNNTGSVLQFDDVANAWRTGGPGYNSIAFSNLQDKTVLNYEDENNSLVATTDNDNKAYLSFDYSNKAYICFNDIDLTFKTMNARPSGNQWIFGTY